jgi:hypothetical protein
MYKIIFDSQTIDAQLMVDYNNMTITQYSGEQKVPSPFNKTSNNIQIKYNKDSSEDITEKLHHAESLFINSLIDRKKNELDGKKCWITCLRKDKVLYDSSKPVSIKKSYENALFLSYNDNLEIGFNNNNIDIKEFQELFNHNTGNFNLSLIFYAVIYTTKENVNISIKLKLKDMKVLELKNKLLHSFKVESSRPTRQFEYFQKNPTGKRKAVNNIMQLFKSENV